jgi:hypothetical protein
MAAPGHRRHPGGGPGIEVHFPALPARLHGTAAAVAACHEAPGPSWHGDELGGPDVRDSGRVARAGHGFQPADVGALRCHDRELPLAACSTVPWWPEERRHPTLHTLLVHTIQETARHAATRTSSGNLSTVPPACPRVSAICPPRPAPPPHRDVEQWHRPSTLLGTGTSRQGTPAAQAVKRATHAHHSPDPRAGRSQPASTSASPGAARLAVLETKEPGLLLPPQGGTGRRRSAAPGVSAWRVAPLCK